MAGFPESSISLPPCVVNPEKNCINPCPLAERNRAAQLAAMKNFNCSAQEHQRRMVLELSDPSNRIAYIQVMEMHGITKICSNSSKDRLTPPSPKFKEILH